MASRNQSQTSLLAKYEKKRAADGKDKENEYIAKKSAADEERKAEIQDHPGLAFQASSISTEEAERFYRSPAPTRGGNKSNMPEFGSEYVLPPRRQPKSPLTPPTSPAELACTSRPETEEFNSRAGNELMAKLHSDLNAQRGHIQRLEKELDATKDEVNRLSVDRDEARKHHRQAIRNGQQDEISRLKLEVTDLNQLLEEAEAKEKKLSATAREEMDRALKTEKQLYDARRECLQVQDELEVLKSTRTASSREECHCQTKDDQTASVTSSRRLSSTTPKRDSEYAFVRPKREKNKILPSLLIKKMSS